MTSPSKIVDNSIMIWKADDLWNTIQEHCNSSEESLMALGKRAVVPYSWLVDLERNRPQKVDQARALDIINAIKIKSPKEEPKYTDTEKALIYSIKELINIILNRSNPTESSLINQFDRAIDRYRDDSPVAASVMQELLVHVRDGKPQKQRPSSHKNLPLSPSRLA